MRSPGKQQYYDPFIEEQEEVQLQLRGIAVSEPGTYILFEDFIDAIRTFAFSAADSKRQQAIYELINWLESTFIGDELYEDEDSLTVGKILHTVDAERVELYPDTDRKWHGRIIDKNGNILGQVNDGDFNRDWVEKDIKNKYPDLEIVQLESEDEDSTWTIMGPSKRLWKK